MSLPSVNSQSNSGALYFAQRAPELLGRRSGFSPSTSIPFLSTSESPETWAAYEKLIYSCLRIGDDRSAQLCLEQLTKRFGIANERIMGLHATYEEAVADGDVALEGVLAGYEKALAEDPTNMPITKRRIALLQSLGRQSGAIGALIELLEVSPTDAEAWTELSALYLSQAMFSQAAFCLEEVLLIYPNAWNIHARLGEILFISSLLPGSASETSTEMTLTEAIHRFCRSIELCDGYLRGFYGLKVSIERLLEVRSNDSKASARELNKKATMTIQKIVSRSMGGSMEDIGYEESELIAAKALLDGKNTEPAD
ncbi:hypothetical protein MMC13_003350 [Lambiella insularis]|nr:hypothetical protein [Lambiella insularis]